MKKKITRSTKPRTATATVTASENTAPLRAKADEFRALLTQADADDIRARYAMGTIVTEVRKGEYGAHAVEKLAKLVHLDKTTLYRWEAVTDAWTLAEVDKLVSRSDANDSGLTWSHLVELAEKSDPQVRNRLADQVLATRHTIAQLRSLSGAEGSKSAEHRKARTKKPERAGATQPRPAAREAASDTEECTPPSSMALLQDYIGLLQVLRERSVDILELVHADASSEAERDLRDEMRASAEQAAAELQEVGRIFSSPQPTGLRLVEGG